MSNRPEKFEGTVSIAWAPGGPPLLGWQFTISDEDGSLITTVTELTLHAAAESAVWAEMRMFCTSKAKPIYRGDIGSPPCYGTFAFEVASMAVERPEPRRFQYPVGTSLPAAGRAVTFAGFLGLGDAVAEDGMVRINVLSGQSAGITRSLRPFTTVSDTWTAGVAGRAVEEVCRSFAASRLPVAAAEDVNLPGDALECWLMPLLSAQFDYLITPAGDWPPVQAEAADA